MTPRATSRQPSAFGNGAAGTIAYLGPAGNARFPKETVDATGSGPFSARLDNFKTAYGLDG